MRVLGNNVQAELRGEGVTNKLSSKQCTMTTKKEDGFKSAVLDVYTNYNKQGLRQGELEKKIIGVTKEQLEKMLQEGDGKVQTDGSNYWMVVDGVLYELKIISQEEQEKKSKSNEEVLLDMTQECIDREQKRLDKVFHDWAMKKDILYPNIGKNAMITLEDLIKNKEEQKYEEKQQEQKQNEVR